MAPFSLPIIHHHHHHLGRRLQVGPFPDPDEVKMLVDYISET